MDSKKKIHCFSMLFCNIEPIVFYGNNCKEVYGILKKYRAQIA